MGKYFAAQEEVSPKRLGQSGPRAELIEKLIPADWTKHFANRSSYDQLLIVQQECQISVPRIRVDR